MQVPEAERAVQEQALKVKWDVWAATNASALMETAGAGKTKLVNTSGVSEIKNDVMLYSIIEAESADAAAALFVDHPHLDIPDATIEVMPANVLPGMN